MIWYIRFNEANVLALKGLHQLQMYINELYFLFVDD